MIVILASKAPGVPVYIVVPEPLGFRRWSPNLHRTLVLAAAGLRATSDSLAATRDLLLPRLVTGRLDISDVDLGVLSPTEVE